MKKQNMLSAAYSLLVTLCVVAISGSPAFGQNCPPSNTMPEFQAFTYTPVVSFNTSAWQSWQYNSPEADAAKWMRFRMMVPTGFDRCADDGKKYPLIVFLHGSGESGAVDDTPNNGVGEQDNDKQMVHGGQKHQTAVQNGTFKGFVIYPQIRKTLVNGVTNNNWGPGNIRAVRYIIDKLIADYKVDPNRIYIHGLSMGGEGAWTFISLYPKYFAAAHPMSAAGSNFYTGTTADSTNYKHIPLRHAQGGLDGAPSKLQGNDMVQKLRAIGANVRYSYYPNGGHSIWNNEYNKSDFFSWFLSHRKNEVWVKYQQSSFCPGSNFSITLGFTPGFDGYQWTKDDTTSAVIGTGNQIVVTQAVSSSSGPGNYYGRFRRGLVWTNWSAPVAVNNSKGPSTTPTISANGSVNLVPLDGSPEVILSGPTAKSQYTWSRVPTGSLPATQSIGVGTAGSYTLQTKDAAGTGLESDGETPTEFRATPEGCLSNASNPIVVTTSNGPGSPATPANFFATSISPNSITLAWDDRSSNELGFEIYRTATPGNSYKLITITPPKSEAANPQSYVDNANIQPNTIYYYRMRAVNSDGGSAYTPEIAVNTAADIVPPTAPVLSLVSASRSEINLSWTASTDAVGVKEYDVYQNGVLIATIPAATRTYKATGLVAFSTYNYVVRARDLANNTSPPSNQIVATAKNSGLFYTYYHHENTFSTVNSIVANSTVIKTGYVSRFLISPRTQEDMFAFIYEGYINIPTSGTYTFYMQSDDGSTLYVNNVLVVNHDGSHGCSEKTGTPINLSAGSYPIKGLYYDKTGGQCLTVRWAGPGISKAEIPDAAFIDNVTPPAAVAAPSNFAATVISSSQINLTWTDNSNNETGFEISRASSTNGTYTVIGVTAANAITFSHTGLAPSSTHFYKIRAINATNASSLVGPVNRTTQSAGMPTAPTSLVGTPVSSTQVNLTWTDNSSNEAGFEIEKSSSAAFTVISSTIIAANLTSYSDTQVNGHSTIYYRVRARSAGTNHSAYSNVVQVNTPNRAPTIQDIPDQTLTASSPTAQTLNLTVTDPDSDPIAISFITNGTPGLPAGITFADNGYGSGVLTIINVSGGPYTIQATGSDGLANTSDSFTLTFSSNVAPVVVVNTPTGFTNSLTTEEGRTTQLIFTVTDANGNATLVNPIPGSITGLPSFATAQWTGTTTNPRLLTLTFAPAVGQVGIYNMSVDFKDASNAIVTRNFTVTVLPLDNFYTVSINFAYTAAINANPTYAEASPWNNTGDPGTTAGTSIDLTNLKDDTGTAIRFVTFNTGFNWTIGNSASPSTYATTFTPDPGTIFTKKVRESFYRKSGGSSALTFKNLNPALQYKFQIHGGGPTAGTGTAQYQIVGGTTINLTLNNAGNASNYTPTMGYIAPAANGTITINVSRPSGTGNVYINGLVMTAQYPSPTPPDAPTGLTLAAPSYNTVNVSWTDMSFNETSFQILRSTTSNGTYAVVGTVAAETTTFTDTPVSGRTTYYYKVRAINAHGGNETNPLVITTPNGAPTIPNPGTITVRVGETIQQNISASDPENDPVTFATLNLPAFATLVDNGNNTGYIRFIPQSSDIGTYQFTLRGTDNFTAQTEIPITVIVLDAELDEAFFVNFKGAGTTSDAPAPWNNRATGDQTALANTSGQTTSGVNISSSGFTAANTGGVVTGNNSGRYPDNVIQSCWTTASITPGSSITIGGLNNAKRYNITLLGSKNEFWFANTTYTVNAVAKTLNTTKNKSNVVRFVGIQPTGNTIVINVKKGANISTLVQRDGTINAMVIESYTEGTKPRKPTNLVAEGISKTDIKLTWEDNSSDETGFEISRATNQAGPFTVLQTTAANTETFTNGSLGVNTGYIYRVRAMKTSGTPSDYTNNALASTYEQIILVSLNYSTAGGHVQAPTPWNNTASVPAEGLTFSNLKNDLNAATTVDLSILTHGSGSGNESGFVPGIYPDNALRNYYYFEQFEAPDQFQLSQLPANRDFDLVFLGDEWDLATLSGVKTATDYIVGTTTVSQFNGRNSTETAVIRGVKSESDGTISFGIKCNDEARYGIWSTLEIRSYTPLSAIFDTEAPSIPNGLVATDITEESFQLNWKPSTDNTAVANYEVYLGSTLITTVADTFAIIGNLQPATTYSVSVRAVDAKLNRSGFSNTLQVTTLNSSQEAVNYYPAPSGDITIAANWGTEVDGTGTHPSNFTTSRQHFNLNRTATVGSAWIITGTDSRLIVNTGSILTINSDITGTVDVEGTATVHVNSMTSPSFGTLSPTSTVTFSGNPNNVPGANYGNLVLDGTNSNKVFGSGSYTVNGNLDIADGISLTGSTGNNTVINILGNLTLQGDATIPSDDQLLTINFISGATQSLSATQTDMRFNHVHVSGLTQLNILTAATPTTLTVGSSTGGGITLDSGAVLNLGKNTLVLEGQGSINAGGELGRIRSQKAEITINSSGTQISNLYFVTNADTVKNIRMNANAAGQVNIRSRMFVRESIQLTNGRLHSQDNIILVSDATGTARIAKIGGTAVFLGKVEFQRYFSPKGRTYRYVSAPVYATTVSQWDRYLPVTGPFTGGSNGNGDYSLFYYDSDNGGWIPYPEVTASEEVRLGRGYSIYMFNGNTARKLRITGPIQQGTYVYPNLATDSTPETEEVDVEAGNGWNLLGNPYASPIRWANSGWQSTGLNGSVYVRTNEIINNVVVSSVFTWNGSIGSLPKGIIAQGQSFWVKATGNDAPTLTINEDAKYDTLSASMLREGQPRNYMEITMSGGQLKDRTYLHFAADATDGFDARYDAYKLPNSYFNISSKVAAKSLAINSLPAVFCEKNVKLNLQNTNAGQYAISFANVTSFDYDVEIRLIDHFTSQETLISEGTNYTFDVTSDPLSFGSERLELQISKPELDQTIAFGNNTSELCGDGNANIEIEHSQRGVDYQIMNDGEIVKTVKGTGGDMTTTIQNTLLQEGSNTISMQASFEGCSPATLTATSVIKYVRKPVITIVDNTISSSYTGTTQWLLDGEPINGATEPVYEPVVSGEYTVLAIGSNCEALSDPVIFAITGVEELGENDFVIFPNPVKTRFIVKVPQVKEGSDMVLQIYNTLGMVVGEYEVTNRSEGISIDGENFRSGLYTLKISAQRRQFEKRFIRE